MLGRQIILFNLQLDGRLFFVFFGNCVCIALFINNLFIRRTEQISCFLFKPVVQAQDNLIQPFLQMQ